MEKSSIGLPDDRIVSKYIARSALGVQNHELARAIWRRSLFLLTQNHKKIAKKSRPVKK